MVYNGYYKVMSNSPKMGHLPTPQIYVVKIGFDMFWPNPMSALISLDPPIDSGREREKKRQLNSSKENASVFRRKPSSHRFPTHWCTGLPCRPGLVPLFAAENGRAAGKGQRDESSATAEVPSTWPRKDSFQVVSPWWFSQTVDVSINKSYNKPSIKYGNGESWNYRWFCQSHANL